jgi:hypothetical protein
MSFLARILTGYPDRFPNPLSAGDDDFARRCRAHGDECRVALAQWRDACGDLPALSSDPVERSAAVRRSCLRAFDVLAKPVWDRFDVASFARHYPVASENEAFRSLLAGREYRIELALRAAQRYLDVMRSPA